MQKSSEVRFPKSAGRMQVEHLVEFICAAHVAQQVESPWEDRGGIALVAEPGQLKTTLVSALRNYPNARLLSDINVTELSNLRGDMVSNRYRTMVFLDFQKLYERNQDSAANAEGVLRALTAEGWQGLPHESQMVSMPGRCFVVLCLTPRMYKKRGIAWKESGFLRRFLWLQYAIANPEIKQAAANSWCKVPIGDVRIPWPETKIPMRNTEEENAYCRAMISSQPGGDDSIQFQIVARTYQILKWHYRGRRSSADKQVPFRIMQGVSSLLQPHGGELVLSGPELIRGGKYEEQKRDAI